MALDQSDRKKKLGASGAQLFEMANGNRGTHNNEFQQIANLMYPNARGFNTTETRGQNMMHRVFDFTGIWAVEQLSNAIFGNFINPADRWFQFNLNREDTPIERGWIDEVQNLHYDTYSDPRSGFYQQVGAGLLEFSAFGNMVVFPEPTIGIDPGVKYKSLPLRQTYWLRGKGGDIDTLIIHKRITAKELMDDYGEENLSDGLIANSKSNPIAEMEVFHIIYPRDSAYMEGTKKKGSDFASVHIERGTNWVLKEAGFDSFLPSIGHWDIRTGELYARGPGHTAKPEVNMINEMRRTDLRARQKAVDPPLFVPDEGYQRRIKTAPSSLNYFRTGMSKEDRIFALDTRANINISNDGLDRSRQAIMMAFFLDQFKLGKENIEMTRGEAFIRKDEDLRQLSKMIGNLMQFINNLHVNTFNILADQGRIPEPPSSIDVERDSFKIRYTSSLAQAQGAAEAGALTRSIQTVAPFAQADPSVMDVYNPKAIALETKNWFNISEKFFNTPQQIAAIERKREQEVEDQIASEQALNQSQVAKNRADAFVRQ